MKTVSGLKVHPEQIRRIRQMYSENVSVDEIYLSYNGYITTANIKRIIKDVKQEAKVF